MKDVTIILPAAPDDEAYESLLPELKDYNVIVERSPGLANAVRSGIESASTECVIVMDADGNHPTETLTEMLKLMRSYDLVCASRTRWSLTPQGLISKIGNIAISKLLDIPQRDSTSGFFAGRRSKLLELPETVWRGYGDYYIELLYHANRRGWDITELAVVYKPRIAGKSHTRLFAHSRQYLRRLMECALLD